MRTIVKTQEKVYEDLEYSKYLALRDKFEPRRLEEEKGSSKKAKKAKQAKKTKKSATA